MRHRQTDRTETVSLFVDLYVPSTAQGHFTVNNTFTQVFYTRSKRKYSKHKYIVGSQFNTMQSSNNNKKQSIISTSC